MIIFSPFEEHGKIDKLICPYTLTACCMQYDYMWRESLKNYLKKWIKSVEEECGQGSIPVLTKDGNGEWKIVVVSFEDQQKILKQSNTATSDKEERKHEF